MKFTKTKLAVALASTLAVGSVHAAFDLEPAPNGHPVFAAEAAINGTTGTTVGTGNNILDITSEVGFSIGEGTSKYVRYDLVNATFDNQIVEGDFTFTNAGGDAPVVTFAVSQGGAAGQSFVIIEVTNTTGAADDVQQDDEITALFTSNLKTTSKDTATMTVRTYGTAETAVAGGDALASANGTIFEFGTGYAASCTPDPQTKKIDVVNPTMFEDGSTYSYVSTFTSGAVPGVYDLDGTAVTDSDYFDEDATFTLTGNMAAFDVVDLYDYGLMTIAGDDASASHSNLPQNYPSDAMVVFSTPYEGTVGMVPGDYTGSLTQGTSTTFDLGGPLDLGTCATLVYSGSTDRLDFGLTPSGVFRQWVRITNPSSTGGDVTVTVYNDDGANVTFPLGDITGSSTLGAYASSGLINIDDVYAAATAADAGFAHNGGKLRVEVRGEFGDDAEDGGSTSGKRKRGSTPGQVLAQRAANGIYIQAVTLASDNTMFDQTK